MLSQAMRVGGRLEPLHAQQLRWPGQQMKSLHRACQAHALKPVHAKAAAITAGEAPSVVLGAGSNGVGSLFSSENGKSLFKKAFPSGVSTMTSDSSILDRMEVAHPAPPTNMAAAAAAAAAADAEAQQKALSRNFINRVIFGLILGAVGGTIIVYGRLPFVLTTMLIVYQATQEYFGLVTSKEVNRGLEPPPPLVCIATTVLCLSITVFVSVIGIKSGTALCVAAFLLLALNVMAAHRPTFSHLTSSVFGLFYCGYLPCFWLKLRSLSLPAPELSAIPALAHLIPSLAVGLVATFMAVACIVAADTGAYFVGKNLGRTKLTDISPKKTVEGAVGGLASAVVTALALRLVFSWPGSAVAAAGYGVLMFFSSIFGDLIESIMKRDAGMKDSGNLIPGHGGLLDRFDGFMFSGAIAWFYVTMLLPTFGLMF